MRVLLTNDDGLRASGMRALERAFKQLPGAEVWVVAPDRGRSACSHGLTLARPVFVKEMGEKRFAVDGNTADCVYLALFGLMPEKPDVVVSGVNYGPNLGQDVIYSGTVAGAREAALRGIHGISVSLVDGRDYEPVAKSVGQIATRLAKESHDNAFVLNLNYPHGNFKGIRWGRLGVRSYPELVTERQSPGRGISYYWLGGPPVVDEKIPGSDGWLVSHDLASATLLTWEQTATELMDTAAEVLPFVAEGEEAPND